MLKNLVGLKFLLPPGNKSRYANLNIIKIRTYVEWSNNTHFLDSWTRHRPLKHWISEQIAHLRPSRVHLCDGSIQENKELIENLNCTGVLIKLNQDLLKNCHLARSEVNDVARLENRTFICSESKLDAGPTNNWMDPHEANKELYSLFENCMRGRTMYVIPFCMGPLDSKFAQFGIQITDSPLVVVQMRIMTRMGAYIITKMGEEHEFVPCLHSVGKPLDRNEMDPVWPCNSNKIIAHFPEQQRICSFGSAYGGNALLGKKCLALRIASAMGREEGWLAEHMLIIGVTNPEGVKKYLAAAFPSACGKTNMAMLKSSLPGWKVECLGDDIAWIHLDEDGRLRAINPELGFFGVAPGTNKKTNEHMIGCIKNDTIYTNVGITPNLDVWWEGKTKKRPEHLFSWLRKECKAGDEAIQIAHENSRFCTPIINCKTLDPAWDDPEGVPIDAVIFGGRRSHTIPLVRESYDWKQGIFFGATMGSETTAAAAGRRGILRIDPFAMRPFCGYNMADYFLHWLSFEKRSKNKKLLPKFFAVNWFRKNGGRFIWPGFGENIRVIKWIFERCQGRKDIANETPIGIMPTIDGIDMEGLDISSEDKELFFKINGPNWCQEADRYRQFFGSFRKTRQVPELLMKELQMLEEEVKNIN